MTRYQINLLLVLFLLHLGLSQAWTILENFESYAAGDAATVTGGVWSSDTNDSSIEVTADGTLLISKLAGSGGWDGSYMDLTGTDAAVAVGETQTFFWQVKVDTDWETTDWVYDCMMGLAPSVSNIDQVDAWQDFAVMPYINNAPATPYINAVAPTTPYWAPMNPDTWYNVWVVVNNDAADPTFDLYYSTGTDSPVLVVSDANWRNHAAGSDLNAIGFMAGGWDTTYYEFDNLCYTTGEHFIYPISFSNDIQYVSPTNGADLISVVRTDSDNDLVFTVIDPNIVIAEVYFSPSDADAPDILVDDLTIGLDGHGEVTKTITLETELDSDLSFETDYYWKVIGYEPNYLIPANGNDVAIISGVMTFRTTPEAPVIPQVPCPVPDLSGDCAVGIDDLALFAEQWLDPAGCTGHPDNCADFVGNDGVRLEDFAVMASSWGLDEAIPVVINEIHYNPDLSYELVEFIELYNAGDEAIDLSGWYFSDGVSYTFPPDTILAAGAYLVITEDASVRTISPTTSVHDKYGTATGLIYGPFTGSLNNDGEKIELSTSNGIKVDQVDYQLGFPWPTVGDEVPEGSYGNGHSIQLVNVALDNDLGASWRSAYPTPGAVNIMVYANNSPPAIRQVEHTPSQPVAGEVVTITAKVTNTDGINSVTLKYQLNDPGSYIHIDDAIYETNWTSLAMHDDGLNGDEYAGDSVYTVQVPAGIQTNRRLIRYRIVAEDTSSINITVPYADDPQPNFAYFVYDGVPAWSGAIKPGDAGSMGDVINYGTDIMRSLPTYHLIAKQADVEDCTWGGYTGSEFLWGGCLVYDGKVYDHIRYRARGGVWRYASGKNMWKFDFNRGHYFQARDDYGRKYDTKWNRLNLSSTIQNPVAEIRGKEGMFEGVGYRLFNLAGVEAPKTHWLQFRIIDESAESGATQYDGDFWGLYLAIEQMDGRFLEEHNLPDGNLYKMDGAGYSNNQGPTQAIDGSDLDAFSSGYSSSPDDAWWQNNVEVERYFSFRTICEGIHHYDMAYKNFFYYHDPDTDLWTLLPWDLDLTWHDEMYDSGSNGSEPFMANGLWTNQDLRIIRNNRIREIRDLLFNEDQAWELLDEYSRIIDDPNGALTIIDADQAMWDYSPYLNYTGYHFYQTKIYTGSFVNLVQMMKDYVTLRSSGNPPQPSLDELANDSDIPDTPTISYIGDPNYPENDLRFQTSAFSDPQGAGTFAAMKWRIAEVEPFSVPSGASSSGGTVRLVDPESDWQYFKGETEPSDPMNAYRLLGFDDSSWSVGPAPIGYGESMVNTPLDDMRGNYTTVYLRKTFNIGDPNDFDTLTVGVLYDDGYNLWINGNHIASANVAGQELAYDAMADSAIEPGEYVATTVNASDCLVFGSNVIAVQVLNAGLNNSSDCVIDIILDADLVNDSGNYQFVYTGKPGKYEINPAWESEELTTFTGDIQIPADGVKPGNTYRVRCRMKDDTGRWSHWSNPIQFVASEARDADILSYLRLTELMYNNGDAEFIELKNISSSATLDLSNVSITDGVQFSFAGSDVNSLAPGDFVLVVKDLTEFRAQCGDGLDDKIAGTFVDSSLSNSGEIVKIEDYWNGTIIEFEYNDARGWPLAADGAGHSLVPLSLTMEEQPLGTLDFGGNWRQSTYIGGSPGADDPAPTTGVVLNEFMAHTDYTDPEEIYDSNDWIELCNAGASSISLNGNWYLSDDSDNLKKWALPDSNLNPGDRISYDEITGFHNPITSGFGLDKAGEEIFLSYLPGTSADRVVDCIQFKGQQNDVSLGRYPDGGQFWFATSPGTRDAANNNFIDHIVISEIMYHPADGNEEYIELYNPTASAVDLWTATGLWALDGGVDYDLPPSTSLASGQRIIIVDFDPAAETARLDAFETAYGTANLIPGVDIFGPWSGDLSNNGERVTLEKPQDSDDPLDPSDISWIIVDECIYNDYWPWPTEPDGSGQALRRLSSSATASGNDANNWINQAPTPGW